MLKVDATYDLDVHNGQCQSGSGTTNIKLRGAKHTFELDMYF